MQSDHKFPGQAGSRGRLLLKFPKELEAEFLASHRAVVRSWARMSVLVALSTVVGFAFIDHWILRTPPAASNIVRFGLQLPLVIIMLVLTSTRFYDRWYQPAIQIAAPLFGLGLVIMATTASSEQLPLIAARLLLAIFFFYFMIGVTFQAALRCNAILIAGYATAAVMGFVAPQVAVYQLFVLLCANLIGAAGCYALERANRAAFLDRRRLAEMAAHDGLTGLLNRAALEQRAPELWRQAARDKAPVSVLLIDIDHFKAYNDYYGHQAGDQCLRDVAAAVRRAAHRRPLDIVARYGGEEMIAVLYGADRNHAAKVARGLLDEIAALCIPHAGSTTQPHVTASVGVATLDTDSHYSVAVQLADRALYTAKKRGRNGWFFHSENGVSEPGEEAGLGQTPQPAAHFPVSATT